MSPTTKLTHHTPRQHLSFKGITVWSLAKVLSSGMFDSKVGIYGETASKIKSIVKGSASAVASAWRGKHETPSCWGPTPSFSDSGMFQTVASALEALSAEMMLA